MTELDVLLQDAQGQQHRRKVVIGDEATLGQVQTKLQSQGLTLLSATRRPPRETAVPQGPAPAPARGGEVAPALAGTVGQIGLPALAALMAGGPVSPALLGALGLVGGLGGAAAARRGLPTLGDVGATLLGEFLPGGQALRGVRTAVPGTVRTLEQGLPRLTRRAGIRLTPGEMFPGGLLRQAVPATERFALGQAEQVTRALGREAGVAGVTAATAPTTVPRLLADVRAQIATLAPDRAGPILASARRFLGVDPTRLTVPQMHQLVRKADVGVSGIHAALRELGIPNASGRVAELWWSATLESAAREAQAGSRLFPALYRGRGGTFFLDGEQVLDAFRRLSPMDLAALGSARRRGLSELAQVLRRARSAQRVLPQLAGPPVRAKVGVIPVNTIFAALGQAIRQHPIVAGLIGVGEAEELLGQRRGRRLRQAGELLGAVVIGRQLGRRVLSQLLSSDIGMRWVALGIEMQNRGTPTNLMVDMLSRTLGQMIARSPQQAFAANVPLEGPEFGMGGGALGIPQQRSGPILSGPGAASLPTQVTPSPFGPATPEQQRQMEIIQRLPELLRLFRQ